MNTINRDAVLSWFSGKSRTNMVAALDALDRSIAQGCWEQGWSRKVAAAAKKANLAAKVARTARRTKLFPDLTYRLTHYEEISAAKYLVEWMLYGHIRKSDVDKVTDESAKCLTDAQIEVVGLARAFYNSMAPVWEAIERLDATRPKPVFTTLGASPTITKTMADLGVVAGGADVGIEVCPMHFEEIETTDEHGRKTYRPVCILDWPAGTQHHTSRFAGGNLNNGYLCQCESCGHAISNGYNWVPMVVTVPGQAPRSLWVGRDCAKMMFGIDVKGEVEIVNRPRA